MRGCEIDIVAEKLSRPVLLANRQRRLSGRLGYVYPLTKVPKWHHMMQVDKHMTATQRIRQHWDSQPALPRHRGAEPQAIAVFEARHSVVLMADFRDYLRDLNGLPEARTREGWDNVDSNGFEFLPLALLRPTPQSERFFVFARWALGDRAYAICLAPSRHHGRVVVVGDSLHVIAESFEEFAKMYVEDSMSLYGDGPVVDVSDL